jgi:hypothetical protein
VSTNLEQYRTRDADGRACEPRARRAAPARAFGRVALTGDPSDRIDAMMHRSHGEVLAPRDARAKRLEGGEYDALEQVSRGDLRRLTAAGLYSSRHGLPADVLAHRCDFDGSADEFVAWWVREGVAGLEDRASRREGEAWHELERPEDSWHELEALEARERLEGGALPDALAAYLGRLIFDEKATYAAAYVAHVVEGATCPTDPGTGWALKVRRRVDSLARVAA